MNVQLYFLQGLLLWEVMQVLMTDGVRTTPTVIGVASGNGIQTDIRYAGHIFNNQISSKSMGLS
jgi:hypothetical protein